MQLSNNCVNMAFPPRRASVVISHMHFPMKGGERGAGPGGVKPEAPLPPLSSWILGPEDLLQWWGGENLSAFCYPYYPTQNHMPILFKEHIPI